MSKAENRLQRLKQRLDLTSQFWQGLDHTKMRIYNPNRYTLSKGVELNIKNRFRSGHK